MTKRISAAPVGFVSTASVPAKAKPQAEGANPSRDGKKWDLKDALKRIGKKHDATLRALAK